MLADAGARDRDVVVSPGARADQRRVPDAALELAERAARGGCGSECPAVVEGHGADRAMGNAADVVTRDADGQPVIRIRFGDFGKPLAAGEGDGARAGQHHVRRLLHNAARDPDRASEIAQRGNRTGLSRRAVHDRCVEFDVAGTVRRRAAAGHVQSAGLEFGNRERDGIECRAAPLEHAFAGLCQARKMFFGGGVVASRDGTCATLEGECPLWSVVRHAANLH